MGWRRLAARLSPRPTPVLRGSNYGKTALLRLSSLAGAAGIDPAPRPCPRRSVCTAIWKPLSTFSCLTQGVQFTWQPSISSTSLDSRWRSGPVLRGCRCGPKGLHGIVVGSSRSSSGRDERNTRRPGGLRALSRKSNAWRRYRAAPGSTASSCGGVGTSAAREMRSNLGCAPQFVALGAGRCSSHSASSS